MKFDVVLHGEIDCVNNFDQRVAKLAELIGIDTNFIGPFLSAKETSVMSNLEFTEARQHMAKIHDLGFKAEVRPTRKKVLDTAEEDHQELADEEDIQTSTNDHLVLSQNRATFAAPTDMPEEQRQAKNTGQNAADTDELAIANDEDSYSNYNWSRDTASDEVVRFDDDLVIKKGR